MELLFATPSPRDVVVTCTGPPTALCDIVLRGVAQPKPSKWLRFCFPPSTCDSFFPSLPFVAPRYADPVARSRPACSMPLGASLPPPPLPFPPLCHPYSTCMHADASGSSATNLVTSMQACWRRRLRGCARRRRPPLLPSFHAPPPTPHPCSTTRQHLLNENP